MKKTAWIIGISLILAGCAGDLVVNIPPTIERLTPEYRDEYVNKGMEWTVCKGRGIIRNESDYRIYLGINNYSPNAEQVRGDIPYEHIIISGYNQYRQLIGVAEKTFLCVGKGPPERWVIYNHTLWWGQH